MEDGWRNSKGDYKVRCDISGFYRKCQRMPLTLGRQVCSFAGLMVTSPTARLHPTNKTRKVPPIVRPEGVDVFIDANDVRPEDYP